MLRRVLILITFIYLIFSLPILVVFILSENFRFAYFEKITDSSSKIFTLKYVFVGDSITKNGGNWSLKLEGNPFISKNIAVNNYTTNQITLLVEQALGYSPNYVFIMAGTNDSISNEIKVDQTIQNYKALLKKFDRKTIPIITLVPLQQDNTINKKINQINYGIKRLAKIKNIHIIDLNQYIAPSGYLLEKFTIDGVHFSNAAYQIWLDEIKKLCLS
ncbi:GDSL-type esterase/lipase family protein [Myxosarcina sp. GI1]|uniref:SGNH/GDSL hydrolase family protein n=1 Tax=Myxosarcina sp. GI1 TaxID=1541065 RepID=UPI00055E1A4A|nr:GDSL-type esterase/lipase family protein [Myxosarcina sp. GI1]